MLVDADAMAAPRDTWAFDGESRASVDARLTPTWKLSSWWFFLRASDARATSHSPDQHCGIPQIRFR